MNNRHPNQANITQRPISALDGGPLQWLGSLLFVALSLFLWIGVTPFIDLGDFSLTGPQAGRSNQIYQLVLLTISAAMMIYGLAHPMRNSILRPRTLLSLLLLWFLVTSLAGGYPMLGIKAIVVTTLVTINAGIYLLLPSTEGHFARLSGISTLIMLAVAYFGIIFMPALSIHQTGDIVEPMLAGSWRGHFNHKNTAAGAMVISAFIGLYAMRQWSRPAGLLIFVLSVFFLLKTGGKTSSAMLPLILLLSYIFEKVRILRIPIVSCVIGFTVLVVGSAIIRPINEFIADLGIDATFTNRADIWRIAYNAILERPMTGYGLKGFWQTPELVYSGGESWAVMAGHGHNAYLDLILMTGIPGLVLALIWLLVLPIRDIGRLTPEQQSTPLTRLFIRIWLFALYNAALESIFFEGRNIIWFMMVMALCGLRLQSRATLASEMPRPATWKVEAHA